MSWRRIKPKLFVLGALLIFLAGLYTVANAATFKGIISGFGGLVYVLEMDGKTIQCWEPKFGDKKVFCKDLDDREFQCDVETPEDGFVSGCT